jgi:hypothetical protein
MKTIKQVTDNILIIYTLAAFFSLIVGIILDSDFLLLIGTIIAVMGALFVNNYRTKHIISILKQNNLWIDEVFEKKDPLKELSKAKHKDGFD